jgi:hypothetical protein
MPIALASLSDISELITALGAFAWPLAAVVFALIFRDELKALAARVTRAKFLGQEAEFGPELDSLEGRTDQLPSGPPITPSQRDEEASANEVQAIYREAATSPKVALMALSADLERRLRRLSAVTGWAKDERNFPSMLRAMPAGIPDELRHAVQDFWTIRNRIVHGAPASDADALRALDIGVEILQAVEQIPVERHYVDRPFVDVFSDPELRELREDVHGVRLRTVSPDGSKVSFPIYPTTRTHFAEGKQVAWEWNNELQWGRSWYRDPETSQPALAWDGALEFVGRHLDDV